MDQAGSKRAGQTQPGLVRQQVPQRSVGPFFVVVLVNFRVPQATRGNPCKTANSPKVANACQVGLPSAYCRSTQHAVFTIKKEYTCLLSSFGSFEPKRRAPRFSLYHTNLPLPCMATKYNTPHHIRIHSFLLLAYSASWVGAAAVSSEVDPAFPRGLPPFLCWIS